MQKKWQYLFAINFSVYKAFVNNILVFSWAFDLPAIIGYLASHVSFMDSSLLIYTITMKEAYIYLTFEPLSTFNFIYRVRSTILEYV
jgi:hypothetical protein